MKDQNILFSTHDLYSTCEQVKSQIYTEIDSFQANYLLSVNLDDVCDYLVEKYSMESLEIIIEKIELINQGEITIPKKDFGRNIKVKANTYLFSIPFVGDGNLFKFKASSITCSPPYGTIKGNELHFQINRTDHDSAALKQELDYTVKTIGQNIEWIRNDIKKFNNTLKSIILSRLDSRKAKLLKDKGLVASLGIPIRQRKDLQTKHIAPIIQKK